MSYTLCGGLGILGRRYGWAADRVRAFDVVTARAQPLRVTARSSPDLFWALLGRRQGPRAVVTAMEAGLVEVLAATGPAAPVMCVLQLNHLGGALGEEPAVPNAVPHRRASHLVRLLSGLDGTDRAALRGYYDRVFEPLAPWRAGRAAAFSFGGGDRTQGLHTPEVAERLREVRERYDPAGLFLG
ncbi:hypothetical protein [Streptomyces tsukubensis]|uniref:Uncharacterized protein n=1 Tax=Streptomyces tsukubensis TaxID=83656 RepID=A0A1V4ABH1_9ACTN|nr:hypothetical protein B1H18_10260 [Streptomyces tsukubensis]